MKIVTSLAEVWIEILLLLSACINSIVTSLAEVWIEMPAAGLITNNKTRHFPCGSVD